MRTSYVPMNRHDFASENISLLREIQCTESRLRNAEEENSALKTNIHVLNKEKEAIAIERDALVRDVSALCERSAEQAADGSIIGNILKQVGTNSAGESPNKKKKRVIGGNAIGGLGVLAVTPSTEVSVLRNEISKLRALLERREEVHVARYSEVASQVEEEKASRRVADVEKRRAEEVCQDKLDSLCEKTRLVEAELGSQMSKWKEEKRIWAEEKRKWDAERKALQEEAAQAHMESSALSSQVKSLLVARAEHAALCAANSRSAVANPVSASSSSSSSSNGSGGDGDGSGSDGDGDGGGGGGVAVAAASDATSRPGPTQEVITQEVITVEAVTHAAESGTEHNNEGRENGRTDVACAATSDDCLGAESKGQNLSSGTQCGSSRNGTGVCGKPGGLETRKAEKQAGDVSLAAASAEVNNRPDVFSKFTLQILSLRKRLADTDLPSLNARFSERCMDLDDLIQLSNARIDSLREHVRMIPVDADLAFDPRAELVELLLENCDLRRTVNDLVWTVSCPTVEKLARFERGFAESQVRVASTSASSFAGANCSMSPRPAAASALHFQFRRLAALFASSSLPRSSSRQPTVQHAAAADLRGRFVRKLKEAFVVWICESPRCLVDLMFGLQRRRQPKTPSNESPRHSTCASADDETPGSTCKQERMGALSPRSQRRRERRERREKRKRVAETGYQNVDTIDDAGCGSFSGKLRCSLDAIDEAHNGADTRVRRRTRAHVRTQSTPTHPHDPHLQNLCASQRSKSLRRTSSMPAPSLSSSGAFLAGGMGGACVVAESTELVRVQSVDGVPISKTRSGRPVPRSPSSRHVTSTCPRRSSKPKRHASSKSRHQKDSHKNGGTKSHVTMSYGGVTAGPECIWGTF